MEWIKKNKFAAVIILLIILLIIGYFTNWFGFGKKANGATVDARLANKFRTNISGNPNARNGCQRGHSICCKHPDWAGCSDN